MASQGVGIKINYSPLRADFSGTAASGRGKERRDNASSTRFFSALTHRKNHRVSLFLSLSCSKASSLNQRRPKEPKIVNSNFPRRVHRSNLISSSSVGKEILGLVQTESSSSRGSFGVEVRDLGEGGDSSSVSRFVTLVVIRGCVNRYPVIP